MLHEHSHDCKFSFFAPHCLSVQKVQTSSITPNSVQVSPPPPSRIMTVYSLTEWQMAFVGPHHMPKILGKNHQSTTKVTLNEPPINDRSCDLVIEDLDFGFEVGIPPPKKDPPSRNSKN